MCDTNNFVPHNNTNSKFILKMYDKNLLQNNGVFDTCKIPFNGYYSGV